MQEYRNDYRIQQNIHTSNSTSCKDREYSEEQIINLKFLLPEDIPTSMFNLAHTGLEIGDITKDTVILVFELLNNRPVTYHR